MKRHPGLILVIMEYVYENGQEGWSAWRIWCHPLASRELIDESILKIMELDKNIEELKSDLEDRTILCERLSVETEALREQLSVARGELADARDELALHKSVDEKLAEFDRELEKVEKMKRGYEKKIAFLEDLLRRERRWRRNSFDDELSIDDTENEPDFLSVPKIDMAAAESHARIDLSECDEPLRRRQEDKKKPEDKKPEGKKAQDLQRAYQEKRAFGLPDKLPEPSAPDDWLFELPDNL